MPALPLQVLEDTTISSKPRPYLYHANHTTNRRLEIYVGLPYQSYVSGFSNVTFFYHTSLLPSQARV